MHDDPTVAHSAFLVGVDVGSTAVKAVVVDAASHAIVWSDYQRHQTRQAEKALELLEAIAEDFPVLTGEPERVRMFITGSGAGPLVEPIGARFVQEVNAVTLAVERLYPDVGSVVELGGQDAKIIIFKEAKHDAKHDAGNSTGKTAIASMNDKCASGTGATIDKCFLKVGMPAAEAARLRFSDEKLHHAAAKCGVFAETDIVNLVKASIPAEEIMCSLADAIVMQNLSVLTRGNTLRHRVLLLGGPNAYLPFLQECWRERIPEAWAARSYAYPHDRPLDELIFVPPKAEYFAAFGAVMYGVQDPGQAGRFKGLDDLRAFISSGRKAKLRDAAGPPLSRSAAELEAFRSQYRIPRFEPARLAPGGAKRVVVGMDGGSTSSKAVVIDEERNILKKEYQLSKDNPIQDVRETLARIRAWAESQQAVLDVIGFGATGYAADVLEKTVRADANIVETVAHMTSATTFFGEVDVVCDIGGQDIKVPGGTGDPRVVFGLNTAIFIHQIFGGFHLRGALGP